MKSKDRKRWKWGMFQALLLTGEPGCEVFLASLLNSLGSNLLIQKVLLGLNSDSGGNRGLSHATSVLSASPASGSQAACSSPSQYCDDGPSWQPQRHAAAPWQRLTSGLHHPPSGSCLAHALRSLRVLCIQSLSVKGLTDRRWDLAEILLSPTQPDGLF